VLVENSTILRDKASRVLDDASEWELMWSDVFFV
jgi:hypothetical protein